MAALLLTFLAAWAAIAAAPGTPIGRWLREALIEAPARWLSRWSSGRLAVAIGAALLVALVFWLGERDGVMVLAMASPELAAALASVELSLYVDVMLTAAAAWSGWRTMRAASPRGVRPTPRARRRRIARAAPANDRGEPHRRAA